jgi:hypothetical protein
MSHEPTAPGNHHHVVVVRFDCGCIGVLCPHHAQPDYIRAAGCTRPHKAFPPAGAQE